MRVLVVTNIHPTQTFPNRSPYNRHQMRIFGERHDIHVICPIPWLEELTGRIKGTSKTSKSWQYELDGHIVEHPLYWYPPRFGRQWYGHCYRWSVKSAFMRRVKEFKPDLIFAPFAYPDGWAAGKLAKAVNLPVVLQVHGSDILLVNQYPARKKRTVESVTAADGIVAVSHDLSRNVQAMGVPADNICVIHDGVDRSVFHPADKLAMRQSLGITEGDPLVLFVGNLLPVKAIDVLLNAFHVLMKSGFAARLAIAGMGPLRAALEQQVQRLGLESRVQFLGIMTQAPLAKWYQSADLLVLPSHSEGVPNVLLEASACGLPWVASQVGGIPEIQNLGRSRLVPPKSPDLLATAIRESLQNPPPPPATGPRDRVDAVADLETFLKKILIRKGKHHGIS